MSNGFNKIDSLLKKYEYFFRDKSDLTKKEIVFAKAISSHISFSQSEVEDLMYVARKVWSERQYLFGSNTSYENIILAIVLKVCTSYKEGSDDIRSLTEYMYGDNAKKNMTSIYRCHDILNDLLPELNFHVDL